MLSDQTAELANAGRKLYLSPSLLSADFVHLADEVERMAEGGADFLHVDVMDGHFVPNITIGPPVVEALRKITDMPLDCHLMIADPDRYLEDFASAGATSSRVGVDGPDAGAATASASAGCRPDAAMSFTTGGGATVDDESVVDESVVESTPESGD